MRKAAPACDTELLRLAVLGSRQQWLKFRRQLSLPPETPLLHSKVLYEQLSAVVERLPRLSSYRRTR